MYKIIFVEDSLKMKKGIENLGRAKRGLCLAIAQRQHPQNQPPPQPKAFSQVNASGALLLVD